jgi:hypothetical protein
MMKQIMINTPAGNCPAVPERRNPSGFEPEILELMATIAVDKSEFAKLLEGRK